MFRKIVTGAALAAAAIFVSACGERVEVPPAHYGKILTKNGWQPETIPPSKFRLGACWWPGAYCDKLVLVEASDQGWKESFRLFMPKDQLNMQFDIRFTLSLKDGAAVDTVFDRVPAEPYENAGWGETSIVPQKKVYLTYGQPILREVVRTVVAKYSINEVASNRERVNAEVFQAVSAAFDKTPLYVKALAFADVQFPDVIVNAKVKAKEREVAIEQEKSEKQVALIKLQTELEKAKAERAIRRERAEAALEENKIYEESMTDRYLRYRQLEILEAMANNSNTVFLPYGALDSLGANVKMFNSDGVK